MSQYGGSAAALNEIRPQKLSYASISAKLRGLKNNGIYNITFEWDRFSSHSYTVMNENSSLSRFRKMGRKMVTILFW